MVGRHLGLGCGNLVAVGIALRTIVVAGLVRVVLRVLTLPKVICMKLGLAVRKVPVVRLLFVVSVSFARLRHVLIMDMMWW